MARAGISPDHCRFMEEKGIAALDAVALFDVLPLQTDLHTFVRVASVRYPNFPHFLDRFEPCVLSGLIYVFKEHEPEGL